MKNIISAFTTLFFYPVSYTHLDVYKRQGIYCYSENYQTYDVIHRQMQIMRTNPIHQCKQSGYTDDGF